MTLLTNSTVTHMLENSKYGKINLYGYSIKSSFNITTFINRNMMSDDEELSIACGIAKGCMTNKLNIPRYIAKRIASGINVELGA